MTLAFNVSALVYESPRAGGVDRCLLHLRNALVGAARRGAARSLLPRRWRPRSPFNWRAAEAKFFQHSASLLICRC